MIMYGNSLCNNEWRKLFLPRISAEFLDQKLSMIVDGIIDRGINLLNHQSSLYIVLECLREKMVQEQFDDKVRSIFLTFMSSLQGKTFHFDRAYCRPLPEFLLINYGESLALLFKSKQLINLDQVIPIKLVIRSNEFVDIFLNDFNVLSFAIICHFKVEAVRAILAISPHLLTQEIKSNRQALPPLCHALLFRTFDLANMLLDYTPELDKESSYLYWKKILDIAIKTKNWKFIKAMLTRKLITSPFIDSGSLAQLKSMLEFDYFDEIEDELVDKPAEHLEALKSIINNQEPRMELSSRTKEALEGLRELYQGRHQFINEFVTALSRQQTYVKNDSGESLLGYEQPPIELANFQLGIYALVLKKRAQLELEIDNKYQDHTAKIVKIQRCWRDYVVSKRERSNVEQMINSACVLSTR